MITKSEFNILAKNLDLSSQDSWSKDYWIKHKDRYFNNILLIDKYCPDRVKANDHPGVIDYLWMIHP